MSAILKDVNGKLLFNKLVNVLVGDKKVASVRTNSKGVASFTYKAGSSAKVEFRFDGDNNYKGHVVKSSLVVNKVNSGPVVSKGVVVANVLLKKFGKIGLVSVIKNYGPKVLSDKVTYNLPKGVILSFIKSNTGLVKYNKNSRIVTFLFGSLSKDSKLPVISMILRSLSGSKVSTYPKFVFNDTVSIKQINRVK